MKGTTKVRLGLAVAALGTVAVAALPASAATQGNASIAGTGTISPGLLPTGTNPQTFDFSGTGTLATTDTTINGVLNCAVSGDDSIGTYAQGSGSFNGSCSTSGGSSTVTGNYDRSGGHVTVTGTATGAFSGSFSGHCAFNPTGVGVGVPPTITAFSVTCTFTINI